VTTTTTNTHGHGSNGDNGNNGSNNANKTIFVAPSNVSGLVILPSYWINSGGNLIIQFSVQFSTNLIPTWTNGSGWITQYWLLIAPGTYNVTLISPYCQPLKLIQIIPTQPGLVSWSVVGKPLVTPVAPRASFSVECGIL